MQHCPDSHSHRTGRRQVARKRYFCETVMLGTMAEFEAAIIERRNTCRSAGVSWRKDRLKAPIFWFTFKQTWSTWSFRDRLGSTIPPSNRVLFTSCKDMFFSSTGYVCNWFCFGLCLSVILHFIGIVNSTRPNELRIRKTFGSCRTRMFLRICTGRPFCLHFTGARARGKGSSQNRSAVFGFFQNCRLV